MLRGDLYELNNGIYILQAGAVISGKIGGLAVTDDIQCQDVPGCDPSEPLYLVRASVSSWPYNLMVVVDFIEEIDLSLLSTHKILTTFSTGLMNSIKGCAIRHKKIQRIYHKYL